MLLNEIQKRPPESTGLPALIGWPERENDMPISRRHILAGAIAAPAVIAAARLGSAAPAQMLKISHQFPGGTIDEGDFRDRLCRKFAAELEKRTNGALGGAGLSQLVADEDRAAVLGGAQRRARPEPLSDLLRGRRVSRAQHRPDAGAGELLRAGRRLEEVAGRPEVRRLPGRARASSSCPGSGRPAAWPAAASRSSIRRTPRA